MPVEKKNTYKNISDSTQELIGVGVVAPGETIETTFSVNNGNFELIQEKKAEPKEAKQLSKK